jgi:hypothetical protein
MAGRPPGAVNKDKPFRDALRMELAAAGADHKALREIARNLIDVARHPDVQALPAIREIADRLDGKPAQAIIGGEDDDPAVKMVHKIERVIVSPPNQDG